ncbi:major facilitator superfamily domain-containing protein [Infundibulicybe gibba]|nr:major facilitator superfamily domain-containing protein [Infundibulicybe gibba]
MTKGQKVHLRSVSLIFACGTALFSDGYANSVIGGVNTRRLPHFLHILQRKKHLVLVRIYGEEALSEGNISRTLTSLSYAGAIIGMLIFGFLSDKDVVRISFFSWDWNWSEYPCGAVAASEQSEEEGIRKNAQSRWLILATNSMIDAGSVIASFMPLVIIWILGDNHPNATWRVSLALGVVPALCVFLWRYNMEESPRYKTDSMKYASIPYTLILRRYGVRLVAISSVWFLYDFIGYPFAIYTSGILNKYWSPRDPAMKVAKSIISLTGGSDSLHVIFGWNIIVNMFLLPGAFSGAFMVDYFGAKNTLIIGLVSQAIIGFIMSALYKQLTGHMAAFTASPNLITFATHLQVFRSSTAYFSASAKSRKLYICVGQQEFPNSVRGQFFGVAAAAGKVGAFVGTWAFPSIVQAFGGPDTARGNTGPFWVGSGVAMLSAVIAFFFIAPVTRDGMIEEDMRVSQYPRFECL